MKFKYINTMLLSKYTKWATLNKIECSRLLLVSSLWILICARRRLHRQNIKYFVQAKLQEKGGQGTVRLLSVESRDKTKQTLNNSILVKGKCFLVGMVKSSFHIISCHVYHPYRMLLALLHHSNQ